MVLHSDTNPAVNPDAGPDMETQIRARPGTDPDQVTEGIPDDQEIDFVTLGMFIIGTLLCSCITTYST